MKTGKQGKYFDAERILINIVNRGVSVRTIQKNMPHFAFRVFKNPWVLIPSIAFDENGNVIEKLEFAKPVEWIKYTTARRYVREFVRRHGTTQTRIVSAFRSIAFRLKTRSIL